MSPRNPVLGIAEVFPNAPREDPDVLEHVREVAGAVAGEANITSAPIGITYRDLPDGGVRIGPRGAAALPLEIGTRKIPARRYVKRALDNRRIE